MSRPYWLARAAAFLLAGFVISAPATKLSAQVLPGAPQDMLRPGLPVDGRIRFCINANSILAEFDRRVARLLADQLLVDATVHDIVTVDLPAALDYRFVQDEVDLFVEYTNNCDALLGYPLPAAGPLPDWLTVTRPYFSPPVLLARRDNVGAGKSPLIVGSLIGTAADGQSRAFGRSDASWKRKLYSSYERMIADVQSGVVDAILIWEPGLLKGLGATLEESGLVIAPPPAPMPALELSIALASNSAYLRTQLDTAITGAIEQGLIAELALELGVATPGEP